MDSKTEIRIRNVDQSLIAQLENIAKEKSFPTITGTVTYLAENYYTWQKNLKEQNQHIQSLQKELSEYRLKENSFKSTVEAFIEDLQSQTVNAKHLLKQFVSKKKSTNLQK